MRIACAVLAVGCLAAFVSALEPDQAPFSYKTTEARVPVVREDLYTINARVRPLLLFWIGRDDIGDARITRREGSDSRRAFELLIGSDPARAPRRINRWGFIVEELGPDGADILGVMSESDEETIEEAKAGIERQDGHAVFKVARATVTGHRATGGTMAVRAPAHFTYRELDELLALIPAAPTTVRTVELPGDTQKGFLVAMEQLLRSSAGPCRKASGARPRSVPTVPYLYNQTIFELTLTSCKHEPELQAKTGTFGDIIDGQFQLKNLTTKNETKFRVLYGASGELLGVPVRATFRPRWWLEVELLLDRTGKRRAEDDR